MRMLLVVLELVLLAYGSTAQAQKQKPKAPAPAADAPAEAPAGQLPAAGQCAYEQPGVKICSTLNGSGSFEVTTFPPALLTVIFEDPILEATRPNGAYYRAEYQKPEDGPPSNLLTIVPMTRDLPARANIVVKTATVSVTIVLTPGGSKQVDTQVHVRDPNRAARAAARVDQLDRRTAELDKRASELEKDVVARADTLLLEDLAVSGLERRAAGAPAITSNAALIVLEAEEVVRIGQRRYLIVYLDNQSTTPFNIRRVQLRREGSPGVVTAPWHFAKTAIKKDERVRGAILLPAGTKSSESTRWVVRVEEVDPSRSVELPGLRLP